MYTTTATEPFVTKTTTKASSCPPFQLIALDLDGTLLRSNHELNEETANYLRYLHQEGKIQIMIATGRAPSTVYDYVRQLHLNGPLPVVCSNGSRGLLCTVLEEKDSSDEQRQIEEVETNASSTTTTTTSWTTPQGIHVQQVFSTPVPRPVVLKTMQIAKEDPHLVVQYYVGEDIFANPNVNNESHITLTKMYMELTGCKTKYVKDDFEEVMAHQGLPSKLLVLCPVTEQKTVMETFQNNMEDGREATLILGSPGGWFIEVLHPDVCKGHGLKRFLTTSTDYYLKKEIPLSKVVAFGDGDNDVEFVRDAGWGVAMKNARDTTKSVANQVLVKTNDEDGVLHALKEMEKKGLLVIPPSRVSLSSEQKA